MSINFDKIHVHVVLAPFAVLVIMHMYIVTSTEPMCTLEQFEYAFREMLLLAGFIGPHQTFITLKSEIDTMRNYWVSGFPRHP